MRPSRRTWRERSRSSARPACSRGEMRVHDPRLHRLCRIAAYLAIAVGAWLRLRNAWTDLDVLGRTTLSDDAFYDFGIARHLSLGHPPSIDGVHPTNGY